MAKNSRRNSRRANRRSRRASRKSRRASRRANRRANRRNSRRNNLFGGRRRRNATMRGGKGIFTSVVDPLAGVVGTAGNVVGTGMDYIVDIPVGAIRGVKGVARNAVKGVAHGVGNLGRRAAHGLNRSISGAFSRKRKNSRRNSRKNRRNNY
jgi:hypothetical protein